jgi:hypothetical protein
MLDAKYLSRNDRKSVNKHGMPDKNLVMDGFVGHFASVKPADMSVNDAKVYVYVAVDVAVDTWLLTWL